MEASGLRDTFACSQYSHEEDAEWSADSTDISENISTNKLTRFKSQKMEDKFKHRNSCYAKIKRFRPSVLAKFGNFKYNSNSSANFACIHFGKELMSQQLRK